MQNNRHLHLQINRTKRYYDGMILRYHLRSLVMLLTRKTLPKTDTVTAQVTYFDYPRFGFSTTAKRLPAQSKA